MWTALFIAALAAFVVLNLAAFLIEANAPESIPRHSGSASSRRIRTPAF